MPVSVVGQIIIGLFVALAIAIGVYMNMPWIGVVIALGVYFSTKSVNDSFISLVLYLIVTFAVMLRDTEKDKTDVLVAIAGGAMIGLFLVWVVRVRVIEWQPFSVDRLHLLLCFYFSWSILIGIGGMLFFNNTLNDWFREILIQLPLVLAPYLYAKSVKPNSKQENYLMVISVVVWFVFIIVNIIHFRDNVVKAVYLYQTGRATLEGSASILLLFSCIAFVSIERKGSRIKYYVLSAILALVAIGIASYRTVWVTVILLLPALFWLSRSEERKQFFKFGWRLVVVIIAGFTYAALRWKLVRLLILSAGQRFTSSSQLRTDPSLVNRYIEWNAIWGFIKNSPIVGYGYGARYWDYDWLLGHSYWTGFTHNGFLLVLLKSGIIGFVMLLTAYTLLTIRSWRLARSPYLRPRGRALMRIAFCFAVYLFIGNLTLDSFAERSALFWLGMTWGAVIVYGREHDRLAKEAQLERSTSKLLEQNS